MTTTNKNKYVRAKDKHDNDYLCPLEGLEDHNIVSDQKLDGCVGKDIVERYSGNIHIETR